MASQADRGSIFMILFDSDFRFPAFDAPSCDFEVSLDFRRSSAFFISLHSIYIKTAVIVATLLMSTIAVLLTLKRHGRRFGDAVLGVEDSSLDVTSSYGVQ